MKNSGPALIFAAAFFLASSVSVAQTFINVATAPGGFIAVGAEATAGDRLVLAYSPTDERRTGTRPIYSIIVATDALGIPIWGRQIYGKNEIGGPVRAMDSAADGSLVLVGDVRGKGRDVWVARLDATGQVLWQRTFGGFYDDVATDVQATDDGGSIVVGRTDSWSLGSEEILVLKLSADGVLQWAQLFGATGDVSASAVRQANDGYYIAGSHEDQGLVLFLEEDGALAWARHSNTEGFVSLALSGIDEGFAVVSHPNVLTRIDRAGNLVWQRSYPAVTELFTVAEDPNGFTLGGSTTFMWAAGVSDLGLLRWVDTLVLPGAPFFGKVRAVTPAPGGTVFFAAEIRIPAFLLAVRVSSLSGNATGCFLTEGYLLDRSEVGALTDATLTTRQPSRIHSRPADLVTTSLTPGWRQLCGDSVQFEALEEWPTMGLDQVRPD